MKEQRRRYLKNSDEFKSLNTVVKMMLEEDEYKRDTFVTLMMKVKPMNLRELEINVLEEEAVSENSKSEESRRRLKSGERKVRRKNKWEGTTEVQRKSLKSLLILALSFFALLMII